MRRNVFQRKKDDTHLNSSQSISTSLVDNTRASSAVFGDVSPSFITPDGQCCQRHATVPSAVISSQRQRRLIWRTMTDGAEDEWTELLLKHARRAVVIEANY